MKVYLLGAPTLTGEWYEWLELFKKGWKGEGNQGEQIVEAAAKRCYVSFDVGVNKNVRNVRDGGTIAACLKQGHGNVLEHVNLTLGIEGVTRCCTHQLVRHRAGCVYSQESFHFVSKPFEIGVPDCLKDSALFKRAAARMYRVIDKLYEDHSSMPERKKITTAIRRLMPDGTLTGLVMTVNVRALRYIIVSRTAMGNDEEMRELGWRFWRILRSNYPLLISDMKATSEREVHGPKI